jgi:hypothetical protein
MKYIIAALLVVAFNANAVEHFDTPENPHEEFSVSHVMSNQIAITFISAADVRAVCDSESRKRGFKGFPFPVEACSFFDTSRVNNKCTIVVGKTTNYHTIGHEMRHCLQGNFHK